MKSIPYAVLFLLTVFFLSCERPTDYSEEDDNLPPAVPDGIFVAYAADGDIVIRWNENVEPDFEYYTVYRSVGDTLNFTEMRTVRGNSYYDYPLEYNTEYFYRLTASDYKDRMSTPSPTVSAIPGNRYEPLVPRDLTVKARNWEGEKYFFLSWTVFYDTDIADFLIYRDTTADFQADETTLYDSTSNTNYRDDRAADFYTTYYYKVKARDKGGLVSEATDSYGDYLQPSPQVIAPLDSGEIDIFEDFIIIALDKPAVYEIILMPNPHYGEIFRASISSSQTGDTLAIPFRPPYISINTPYYWRVLTYSNQPGEPNSISPVRQFTFGRNN